MVYMEFQFSVLNESNLHNTLKTLYSVNSDAETEVKMDGFVFDIVTCKGEIIEIQNQNLSKLESKIKYSIENHKKITIVHPAVVRKNIETRDEENNLISRRKSPKNGSIYSILRELTKIFPYLLDENICLEVPLVVITEIRTKGKNPVQSKNNLRRHLKDWNKVNKKLEEVIETKVFRKKEDYLNLLPGDLPELFCVKDIQIQLKNDKNLPSSAAKEANLLVWLYSRMGLIKEECKKGKAKYYKIA